MTKVRQLLGVSTAETVRTWVRQAEVVQGARPGVASEESAEVKRLKRENVELRRANSILKATAAFSEPSSTGLPLIVEFIREHADRREATRQPWPALGCRADLHRAERARTADRPHYAQNEAHPALELANL